MAHRDEARRLLRGHDASHARASEHIAFRSLTLDDEVERFLMHRDEALGNGDALGVGLGRHVDHAHIALLVDVGELLFV